MKTLITTIFSVFLMSIYANAQQMNIHTKSGTDVYNLAEIDSITFIVEGDTSGNQQNIAWVSVPAGAYTYGEGDTTKTIAYDYYISKYEITNAQYVKYLEAALAEGKITVTANTVESYYSGDVHWSAGTYEFLDLDDEDCRITYNDGSFNIAIGYENHPVVDVTWFGANAFAEYYGWKLPTEYEWEKAARGNTGYDYPWGDDIDGSRANYYNSGDPYEQGDWAESPQTTPVGYYNGQNDNGFQTSDSPSPYGAYDMAGNVLEWTLSFYSQSSGLRVFRGGSCNYSTIFLQSWVRRDGTGPAVSVSHLGFRVSRTF